MEISRVCVHQHRITDIVLKYAHAAHTVSAVKLKPSCGCKIYLPFTRLDTLHQVSIKRNALTNILCTSPQSRENEIAAGKRGVGCSSRNESISVPDI